MDTLIELIVRGLIALFSGGDAKPPPPRQLPKIPPIPRKPLGPMKRPYPPRPPAIRQAAPPRGIPVPLPPTPKAQPSPPPAKAPSPSPAQPTINAAAVRQLLVSRRSALRTVYVLSEIVGPPLALRKI
jgi:hypothetical protein